jgi:hypothetical protein
MIIPEKMYEVIIEKLYEELSNWTYESWKEVGYSDKEEVMFDVYNYLDDEITEVVDIETMTIIFNEWLDSLTETDFVPEDYD